MKQYVVFFSTLFIFVIEAIIHYNIGRNHLTRFEMPNLYDIIKIVIVVAFFSLLNTLLISYLD